MNSKGQKIIINIEGRNYPNWKIDLKNKLKTLKLDDLEIDTGNIDLSCKDISEIIEIANQYDCKIIGFCSSSAKTIVSSQSLGYKSQFIIENYSKRVPMNRMANKDEIVGTVLYLASDASSYVTGQNIYIDGGLSAW